MVSKLCKWPSWISSLESFVFLIGWTFGCIHSNLNRQGGQGQGDDGQRQQAKAFYKHPGFYYSCLIILYNSMMSIWWLYNGFSINAQILPSLAILTSIIDVLYLFGGLAARTFYLSHLKLVKETVSKFGQLDAAAAEVKNEPGSGSDCDCGRRRFGKYELAYCLLVTLSITVTTYNLSLGTYEEFLRTGQEHLLLVFLARRGQVLLGRLSILGSKLFSNGLILVFGQKLINGYKGCLNEYLTLVDHPEVPEAKVQRLSISLPHLAKSFRTLQESFDLYNKLVGVLLVIITVDGCVLGIIAIYHEIIHASASDPYKISKGLVIIDNLLPLFLIIQLGQQLQDMVRTGRQKVKLILLDLEVVSVESEPGQVANHSKTNIVGSKKKAIIIGKCLVQFKWKLSAIGLFDVNYGLFSKLAGTIIAYLMFIFQLQIAEGTTNGLYV